MSRKIKTEWEVWAYDVWGNAEDGYQVNDRTCLDRHYNLEIGVTVNNPNTEHKFFSAFPSDKQIKEALGIGCKIETNGDDLVIYVDRASDGKPLGEMICLSHESLSPIRKA